MQTLYVISAVLLSVIIIGASCFQFSETSIAIEIPFESPMDEDTKEISDDFVDDMEYISRLSNLTNHELDALHSGGYLISHINQVKEISTPPPKC